jgi:hypothetical protein
MSSLKHKQNAAKPPKEFAHLCNHRRENQLVAYATKAQDKVHIICTIKIGRIS